MTNSVPEICLICEGLLTWPHDHQPDNTGIDDGPPLRSERKRPDQKPPEELREIRHRAWATRREKYGRYGHR